MTLINTLKIFYQAASSTIRHDGVEHAGYLSFLLILAIFPFLVFFTAIIGPISQALDVSLIQTLTEIILSSPLENFIDALKPRIIEITHVPPQSFLTMAIISAVWTASSIFEAMRTALNKAYDVQNQPAYIFRRMLSILEFIIIVATIAMIIIILITAPIMLQFIEQYAHIPNLQFFSFITDSASLFRTSLLYLFGLSFVLYIYCFLPSNRQSIISALPGAIVVMILWSISSNVFQYYIAYFPQISLIYGSIAGIIISLLYFYMCSLILIYGAELNHIYAMRK